MTVLRELVYQNYMVMQQKAAAEYYAKGDRENAWRFNCYAQLERERWRLALGQITAQQYVDFIAELPVLRRNYV